MEFHVKKLQHGPTIKLILSVIKKSTEFYIENTDPIHISDMAMVQVTFKSGDSDHLQFNVSVKKQNNNKNSTIVVNIAMGDCEHESFVCSNTWIDVLLKTEASKASIKHQDGTDIKLFVGEVNITVHKMMAMYSMINEKLYSDTKLTDFRLYAEDGSVLVHKAMLFIHSDTFRTKLTGEWKETRESDKLEGVTVKTLQHLKDYMYLGILPYGSLELEPLLLFAVRYMMDNLKANCITELVQQVQPKNLSELIKVACANNIPELAEALVLQIPDEVVTRIHLMKVEKIKQEERIEKQKILDKI